MALQLWQRKGYEYVKGVIVRARRCFPDLDRESALVKYIRQECLQDVFFLDEDGNRCVYREDINYMHNCWDDRDHIEIKSDCNGQMYLLRKNNVTLKDIDRPKPTFMRRLITHTSESGWHLPVEHDRHFFQFPQEIQDRILHYALCIADVAFVQPKTVSSNRIHKLKAPTYYTSPTLPPELLINTVTDKDGSYHEIREIYRMEIDATCMRTCKKFYKDGLELLYSKNSFLFEMANCSTEHSRPSCFWVGPGTKLKRVPSRAGPLYHPLHENVPDIESVFTSIASRSPVEDLPDYVYFDPFLRFIYSIGPTTAALIKTLKFDGLVKLHKCRAKECRKCGEDLVSSLVLYAPFIRKFCTGVENLVVVIDKDVKATELPKNGKTGEVILKEKHEQALELLLEVVRGITTLKELIVLEENRNANARGKIKCNWNSMDYSDTGEIAKGTIEFIKKRAKDNNGAE
ncbi:hypothetical protein BDZ45DRAFT_769605 [Acephala macrosclerotiorum]|nr:hypothetical protein BDZ45DRAFT_769605 [Acephala macrosclerotiorum]